jgi:MinD-like ATPase involved in chromosome partitioning or flagellar assembly
LEFSDRATENSNNNDLGYNRTHSEEGGLYLIPSSIKAGEIARILREGYDVGRLNDGFQELLSSLDLDYLLIDTHPGLNEETLLSIAISDTLVVILRPDRQDYQGTAVTIDIARKLEVPKTTPSIFPLNSGHVSFTNNLVFVYSKSYSYLPTPELKFN